MLRLASSALLLLALAGGARAAGPGVGPTISVDEIKPGMVGYGLTVFEGDKPERFAVRVVAVLHNFQPKQDAILIRSDDPRLIHAGIVQGMSGSPIYIEGRLAGALAYGWGFAKDPIAGVTPIGSMLKELDREQRNPFEAPRKASAPTPRTTPGTAFDGAGLHETAVPLQVSGLSPAIVAELGELLAPYHLVPQQAGGSRGPRHAGKPLPFEPGSAIAVELIRGDISAVGTGTVTAVAGDRVLAFGHPMFNSGEVALPIATAVIHTFMASMQTSFKLSSPVDEAGVLLQDRQSGIIGDTKRRVAMVPMSITVHAGGRKAERFDVEVARHRFLTPVLAASVAGSAASAVAGDIADATVTVKSHLLVRGEKPLELVDHVYAPDGLQARLLASTQGLRALSEILFNPYTPATVDRVDLDIDVAYHADVAEIVEAGFSAETVEPGSRPSLRVTLRAYDKGTETIDVPVDIPESAAGQTLKVTVQAGSSTHPDTAPPESLHELLVNLGRVYSARAIVVGVELPDEGLTIGGRVVPELPSSVLDSLRPSTAARRSDVVKHVDRKVVPTSYVTVGKQELTLRVRERR